MESVLKGLNVAQRAAVTSTASVLQVLAPPGSGKTKTLTSRVAYLLSHHGFAPRNVICCTFTIKASREMRERLRGLVGCDLESKVILGTFHSICRRYLVTYGYLIGIPKNFGIADSDDSLGIIKRIQKRLKLSIDPKTARSRISHRKARGKRLEDLPKATKTIDAQEFATISQEYESALKTSNLLDYDDLLLQCVELLRLHPECVANVEALLVDEFQDTNVVQFELMKLLASSKKRITIVGDPDQSIYGFRSAEIENLKRMKEYYPDTVVINLEENYRSCSAILHLAQDVIEQDTERPDKRLKATHCYGTLPVLRRLPNPHEEALWIVSEIKRMHKMTGELIQYSDIAVLLRSAFLSLLLEKALANAGIPYRMVGGRRFFDRVEVRIVLNYLRAISHPDNNSAILSIINTPSRKIGDTTVSELNKLTEEKKQSLWSILQQVLAGTLKTDKKLSKAAETGLKDLVSLIKQARRNMDSFEPAQAPGQLIEFVVQKLDFEGYLKKQYREDYEERWENVQELATQARDATFDSSIDSDQLAEIEGVKQDHVNGSQEVLARFLANVALSTEVEKDDSDDKPRITISTIHSAKGLEWPVVFVPAVYEGSIPHSRAEDTDEERRLLYVAITRAKALLYLTFPVMQSRDQSESVLTQFLPDNLHNRLAETGCGFVEKVVDDIATILQRPAPSQEALAKGVTSLQETESAYDDVWPSDGSHRPRINESSSDFPGFVLQSGGRSLAEALQPGTSLEQRRDFSTLGTFTTASYQMSLMPPQEKGAQAPAEPEVKPLKTDSSQHYLRTFFTSGSFTTKTNATELPSVRPSSSHRVSLPTIPSELSRHKISTLAGKTYSTSVKRSRPILGETSPNQRASKKGHYNFLSSSPPPEDRQDGTSPPKLEDSGVALPSKELEPNSTAASASSKPASLHKTTMNSIISNRAQHSVTNASISTTSTFNRGMSYQNGMLDTLAKPLPLLANPASNGNSQRRALGVRRTMTSWSDRKNK